MLAFKDLQMSDKKMFDEYCGMWRIENSELSFPSLYIWRGSGMVQWAEEDGVLFIKIKWGVLEGPEHFYALIPRCDQPLCGAMQKAVDYCREQRIPFVMRGVPQWLYEMIVRDCPDQYVIEEDRDNFDYVYRWEDLAELKGKKYHGKRNHINKFLQEYSYEYLPLTADLVGDCKEVYLKWMDEKSEDELGPAIEAERMATWEALDHFEELSMVGGVIKVNGRVEAFSLGEFMKKPGWAVVHIEKANSEIPGLYPLINQQFVIHALAGAEFVNREEDMGLEGLRKAKLSYQPAEMVKKYVVTLKEDA
ncbi:DUF2156 domain-containing protein [Gehongia tenuis]|uniref:DUF2156 domain-containing protein n=1 Tax=Gehongia tenuis TaxID=2763655 RepID=A0A926D324_9FIRM|nr:phosphatidylglycerol lysyltransferase domain-containing protein [Gehongia tenuis]MBC8530602.1 DUF2156 domain-containing protein [Gehongia tenuis]